MTAEPFDYETVARRALARAQAAGDTRAARTLAACLPQPLTPAQAAREHSRLWEGVISRSSVGTPPPDVTRIP